MLFSNIIGQKKVKDQLISLVKDKRLSHAIMLRGKEGVGSLPLSIAFAQYILCENKQNNDACGECAACKKVQKLIHPDLHFIFPVIKDGSKPSISDYYIEDWRQLIKENQYFTLNDWEYRLSEGKKKSAIYVDESSEIIKKLNFKAFESDYKVMIIWLPEKMNQQTANKLLKTLEEPAEKTVLILVAENTDFMLSTILSRVQQIKIPTIDKADIKSYLSQKYSLSDDLLNFAINYGKGSLPQTINSIETSENQHQYFLWFTQLMRFNYANKMLDTINLTDEILSQDKSQLQNFLKYAIRYIRDNFMLNQEQDKMVFLIEEEQEFANKFSKFITSNNIEKIYNTFNNTLININKNANVKIQMQILSIELVRAFSMV